LLALQRLPRQPEPAFFENLSRYAGVSAKREPAGETLSGSEGSALEPLCGCVEAKYDLPPLTVCSGTVPAFKFNAETIKTLSFNQLLGVPAFTPYFSKGY
jgi:hypothetical protein